MRRSVRTKPVDSCFFLDALFRGLNPTLTGRPTKCSLTFTAEITFGAAHCQRLAACVFLRRGNRRESDLRT